MKDLSIIKFLVLSFTLVIAVIGTDLQNINIYAKLITTPSKSIELGSLNYDKTIKKVLFINKKRDVEIEAGDYCIGTADLINHDCFTYTELKTDNSIFSGKQFQLQLDKEGDIEHVSLINGAGLLHEDGETFVDTVIVDFEKQPVPNLSPSHLKSKVDKTINTNSKTTRTTKKIVRKINQEGKEIEEEEEVTIVEETTAEGEEEDERSWIQKNWMYVVPPLLIMFAMGGGDK